jgi:hypothetical protein
VKTVVSKALAVLRHGIDHVDQGKQEARIEIAALYPTAWEDVKAECSQLQAKAPRIFLPLAKRIRGSRGGRVLFTLIYLTEN